MRREFEVGFFLIFVVEWATGLPHGEHEADKVRKRAAVCELPLSLQMLLFCSELLAYGCEYALFITFVVAMPLGLR